MDPDFLRNMVLGAIQTGAGGYLVFKILGMVPSPAPEWFTPQVKRLAALLLSCVVAAGLYGIAVGMEWQQYPCLTAGDGCSVNWRLVIEIVSAITFVTFTVSQQIHGITLGARKPGVMVVMDGKTYNVDQLREVYGPRARPLTDEEQAELERLVQRE